MRLGILTALLFIFRLQHVFHCSPSVVPGYLDFDNLPDTNFSCEGKVIGGYYADVETGCQMFHVCTIGQKGEITDIKFLCLNGTVFDQETRVCERVDEVDCSKTEGFYDLNLELYGNNAALSFPEEEDEEETESQENAETSDTSSDGPGLKHKTSTSKPSTTLPPSSTIIIPHPASTTTPKTPVHPFVPTTTVPSYKPNHLLNHFHSTTTPSIAAFLAINNAFSSSNTNEEGNKFGDNSSQYDEDEEDSITDHPGIVINGGTSHHFPVTTISSQIRPVSPEQHNILQPNVKVHGTGESGLILNQGNRQQQQQQAFQSQKSPPPTSTHSTHLYGNDYQQTPPTVKDATAHSKHQINTQFILNQQRDNDNKQHHGFKPISNSDNRNQFLFSPTTRQPSIFFTTKSPSGYSTTIRSPTIEPFSLHAIGPQPPLQTTQQSPSNSPFPPQTNGHQVPPNPLVQQIHSNIANNGGFLTQTIQLSQNPLTFQFNSNGNNYQGHQLFTTPSVAVIATTSSTSSSSSIRSGPAVKTGDISPVISLTSSIGSTPKGSSVTNNSSVSVQLFSETTPPNSYDEYQEGDVSSDPFFRDVPKISKSTQLKSPSPTRLGVVRKKRGAMMKNAFVQQHNTLRYKRKAAAQVGLPTEVFGTGEGRYRNRPGGLMRGYIEESGRQSNSRGRTRVEPQSRKTTTPEEVGSRQTGGRSRPSSFVAERHEVSTVAPEVPQQPPHYPSTVSDIPLQNSAPKHSESAILDTPVRTDNHPGHRRTVVKVRRPHNQNVSADTKNHHPSEISKISDHAETSTIAVGLTSSSSEFIETSYEIPKASVKIKTENSQTPKNVPAASTHDRGENRRQQHQLSRSNLEQEPSIESNSRRSRQRSRQRATDNAHEINEHLSRSSVTPHLRDGSDAVLRSASRGISHRHSDSENIEERIPHSPHVQTTTNIRGHRRKLGTSRTSQDVTRSDIVKPLTDEKPGVTTEAVVDFSSSPSSPTTLPETSFTCADKIPGGYYADLEADCQLFHICSLGRHGKITDNKFLCGPGTRFNQRSRTCQVRDMVDCNLSASLYHLNSHFKLDPTDDTSKDDIGFDAQKIRTKRKAPKASPSGDGPQPQYSIDDLPETSFTCADKSQDGLYADVEAQCQVFHLCRTISGELTLESSFVCPPGTVFNQPEGNCDSWKEVDCALYSAPEHSFKKTSPTASRNQGSKVRNKRHSIKKDTQIKSKNFMSQEKEILQKLRMHKKYRMKRDTSGKQEEFDYYAYVDDNYEAHAENPNNTDVSSENDQIKQSEDNIANVEDYAYDYDSAAVSSEKDANEEPYLLESQENVGNDQEHKVPSGKLNNDNDSSNKTSESYESFVPYTTERNPVPALRLDQNESKTTTEEIILGITSVPVPDKLVEQNKPVETKTEDKSDYVYEYEYDEEGATTTSAPRNIKKTSPTLEENKYVSNDSKSIILETKADVKTDQSTVIETKYHVKNHVKTDQSTIIETNYRVKNDDNSTNATNNLVDIKFSPNITENILDVNNNAKSTMKNNVEIKTLPKLDSAHSNATSDGYEYEYYYDEDYADSNETETDIKSEHLSSAKAESQTPMPANGHKITSDSKKQRDDSGHYAIVEENKQQTHSLPVELEENVNDKLETSNLTTEAPASFEVDAKAQNNIKTTIADHNTQKLGFTETGIISELYETNTNRGLLQEIEKSTTVTAISDQIDKTIHVSNDDYDYDDEITLASLTTQLHKKTFTTFAMETTTLGLSFDEQTAKNQNIDIENQNEQIPDSKTVSSEEATPSLGLADYDTTIATTAEPQKESTSPIYDTTSYVEVTPHLQRDKASKKVEVTPPQSTQRPEDQITVTEATVLTSLAHTTAPTSVPSTIPSLFRPSKARNSFRNRFSTPIPPPVVIQSRVTLASRKPTIRRNQYRGTTNQIGNNITGDEAKSRKSHRFTVPSSEKPITDVPRQVHSRRTTTTTLAPSLVINDSIINDQVASSQNSVPSIQSSEMIKSEETSTVPYLEFGTYDVNHELKTESSLPFTKSSKISANTIDKLAYSKDGALYSSTVSTEPTLSTSGSEYDKHNFTTVNTSNDGRVLNHSGADDSYIDYAARKNSNISEQNTTTALIFSTNDLAFPVTTTSNVFRITPDEDADVLPNTSPSSHLGYTLSSVNSQPSVSTGFIHATGFVCTGKELYQYHPDPDDCRMFHYCSSGFHNRQVLDFRFMCEDGTAFKADSQKCENEFLVPTCVNFQGDK